LQLKSMTILRMMKKALRSAKSIMRRSISRLRPTGMALLILRVLHAYISGVRFRSARLT
jgi:hypothetical protein